MRYYKNVGYKLQTVGKDFLYWIEGEKTYIHLPRAKSKAEAENEVKRIIDGRN